MKYYKNSEYSNLYTEFQQKKSSLLKMSLYTSVRYTSRVHQHESATSNAGKQALSSIHHQHATGHQASCLFSHIRLLHSQQSNGHQRQGAQDTRGQQSVSKRLEQGRPQDGEHFLVDELLQPAQPPEHDARTTGPQVRRLQLLQSQPEHATSATATT